MFNKLLGKVDGVEFWMVVSLIIFAVFFVGVVVRLLLMKKASTDYLKNLPLTENEK